jgi:hypothetical protein
VSFAGASCILSELVKSSLAFRAPPTSRTAFSDGLARLNGDPMLSRSAAAESCDAGPTDPLESRIGEASAAAGVGDLLA